MRSLSRERRLSVLLAAFLLAQSGAVNTIPQGEGYGAANAGGTGKLPPGPGETQPPRQTGTDGLGRVAGPGGPATGQDAGGSAGNVETGGSEGAGSR